MSGRIIWYKPRSHRHLKRKIKTLPVLMPALLLLFGLMVVAGWKWVAAVDCYCPPGPDQQEEEAWPAVILRKALGESVPGLKPPPIIKRQAVCNFALDTFCKATGGDLRDLRTILHFELGAGPLLAMPALSPAPPARPLEEKKVSGPPVPPPSLPTEERSAVDQGAGPVVLIYHTHITESFLPSSQVLFTENMDLSVCRLGEELARLLEEQYGFTVVHHRQIYDQPRRYAYEKARPAIEGLLQGQGPFDLVLDLHRDGVVRASTTAQVGGSPVGRILFVVGTLHQEFGTNLKFTLRLQQELESLIPGLSRGVRQQNFVYNQDLHPYSALVEIGGHENSIEEALLAVPYLAEAVARAGGTFFEREE